MNKRKLSAGDTVESRCTRCRSVLNHTIVAMVAEQVVRVQCNTCGGIHNYHQPQSEAAKSAPRATHSRKPDVAPLKTTGKDPRAADREELKSLLATLPRERTFAYEQTGAFRVNDLLEHPAFGLGVVRRIVDAGKMEVLFEAGRKLLRCR